MKFGVVMILFCGVIASIRSAEPQILGRWESQGGAVHVTLSISKVGDFYFVNQRWTANGQPTAPATVKYTASDMEGRTLLQVEAELNLSRVIPRKMECVVEAEALVVNVLDGPYVGRHRLTRPARTSPAPAAKSPPSGATTAKTAAKTAVAKAAPPASAAAPVNVREKLLGGWITAPGAAVTGRLFFSNDMFSDDDIKLGQEWRKGDVMSVQTRATFAVTLDGSAGSLVSKDDMESTPDLAQMKFALQGDTLVITFERGKYTGSHVLKRKPE